MLNTQTILDRLNAALESLVEPSHLEFFVTPEGDLSSAGFKAAYQEADRKYQAALKVYEERGEALQYGIMHYEAQLKLELAHELIDLDGEE
ncbi:hypothetical protein VPHD81_0086 [Vibrio phage D81]